MSTTVQIGAFIPVELAQAMRELADRNERTVSAEIRIALRRHIEQATQPASDRAAA
jgi:hypothetical protein